jgi:prefoldin subunit 5
VNLSGNAGFFYDPVLGGVIAMVDRSELQRMARTIDAHRKQLDDLHTQIERVSKVIEEHLVTSTILSHLQKGAKEGSTSARLTIGSGVTLRYTHEGNEQGTALVDLGSGVFGEKPWDEAERITKERLDGINLLQEELQAQSTALEIKITGLAEDFNEAASTMTAEQPTLSPSTPAQTPPSDEDTNQAEAPKRPSRRKGRIGKELTLDD